MTLDLKYILLFLLIATPCYSAGVCDDANNQGCYLMEDADDESDESGNTSDILTETSTDIPTSTTKKFGTYSRDFEAGDNDRLNADSAGTEKAFTGTAMSACAWIYPESTSGDDYSVVVKWTRSDSVTSASYWLGYNTSSKPFFRINGTGNEALGTTSVSASTWMHICGVYDGSDIIIYVDGTSEDTFAFTDNIVGGSGIFQIGCRGTTTDEMDGLIDDVCMFDDALTSVEVADIRDNGCEGAGAGGGSTFKPQIILSRSTQ